VPATMRLSGFQRAWAIVRYTDDLLQDVWFLKTRTLERFYFSWILVSADG